MVTEDGDMLGVMSSRDAYSEAEKRGLDLVEISPNANPPVCKLMDYGKFKYEQKKKAQGQKKQSANVLKEITLGPQTAEHDLNFKVRNAMKFLADGHRVKFTIRFRGRQMAHPEIGRNQMEKIAEMLSEVATRELAPKMEGRFMAATFAPTASAQKSSGKSKASGKAESGKKAEPEKKKTKAKS